MINKRSRIASNSGNPFSDNQARNYSDKRVVSEFCPISPFWSLFNDQHEVVIGARGCGKTVLFKMMRYSMLKNISDPRAKKIIDEKNYIAFYIPLHLEYIKKLSNSDLSDKDKITWFRFSFNCILAQSVILEISELIKDAFADEIVRIKTEYELSQAINEIWTLDVVNPIHQFWKIRDRVSKLYYGLDPLQADPTTVPPAFSHSLGSSLSAISNCICGFLNIAPTWILCVDEAEFIDECYQRCINSAFRSDTDHIAIKMATLPYYHTTKKTLDENIEVMNGQDFKYTIVDMDYDSQDFIRVADSIVRNRFAYQDLQIDTLKQFVCTLGDDNYLDYYSAEVGPEKAAPEYIQQQIMSQLSEGSQRHNIGKTEAELKKPVFDKLAPIFYLREVYKKKKGRYIPGWYAGAAMIRRVSQGNPRIFIRIMNDLYDEAVGHSLPLSLKQQHKILESFSKMFCRETETLSKVGLDAKKNLDYIAQFVHEKTHKGELTQTGLSFKLSKDTNLTDHLLWLQEAIAFSRLSVDKNSLFSGITSDSLFQLSNLYAACYWLPMRSKTPIRIKLPNSGLSSYTVITPPSVRSKKTLRKDHYISGQLSLLSAEGDIDYDS